MFQSAYNPNTPEYLNQMTGFIANPPETEKYQVLRDANLELSTLSQKGRKRQLRRGLVLGYCTLTELLRSIRALGGGSVEEAFIKEVCLSRMDRMAQAILVMANDDSLDKLAAWADKIHAVSEQNVATVKPAPFAPPPYETPVIAAMDNRVSRPDSSTDKRLDALLEKIEKLQIEMAELKERARSQSRGRSFSRRPYDRLPPSSNRNTDLCWYHATFSENAQRCTQPCAFNKQ